MQLSEALARTHITRLTEFTCLADVLEPELIQSCLDSQGVATLRRRKLPMDAMIWAVIGMALFRGGLFGHSSTNSTLFCRKRLIMLHAAP